MPRLATLLLSLLISCLIVAAVQAEPPVSVIDLVHRSREKVAVRDLDAALRLAREAVEQDPAYGEAWKQQGRVLMLLQSYPEAIASLETSMELQPEDAETPVWMLDLILELDKSQAAQLLARWEADTGSGGPRLVAPALRHMFSGNLGAAQQALEAARPDTEGARNLLALAWTYLGKLYQKGKKPAKAIAAYQQALRLRPDWLTALRELGWAYRSSGKPAQAAATWERVLERHPDSAAWVTWIAEARLAARQPIAGSPGIQGFLAREPAPDPGRVVKLALLLQKDQQTAQAYEAQVRQRPNGERLITLGHALAERFEGLYAEAARRLENLRRSQPDDPEVHAMLVETYSQWAAHLPIKDKSGPLQKLAALEPGKANTWGDLGWSLWANKQREPAIQAWSRAISLEKNRQTLIVQVVALLSEEGEGAQAIELYRRWQPGGSLAALGIQLVQAGRTLAADPILEAAWQAGDDPPRTGLYLALAKSQKGFCTLVPQYLAPLLAKGLGGASPQEVEVLLKALETCIDDSSVLPLLSKVESQLARFPAQDQRLSALLETAASERQSLGYNEEALKLYRRTLARAPDRPLLWFRAAELAHMLGSDEQARALLTATLARSQSQAVQEGIRGKLAQDQANFSAAVVNYRQSLAYDAGQPEVRLGLFQSLLALKQYPEARREADWFISRVARGEFKLKIFLAEIRSDLGEYGAALNLWRDLHLIDPDNPYYALEMARCLFAMCRAREALEILAPQASRIPTVHTFELLAEIEGALDHPRQVLVWTEKGLALKATRRLLEMRVEAADALNEYQIVLESGKELLNLDRGYEPAARAVGRALMAQPPPDAEAQRYYEGLLQRNSKYLPSQVALKDIAAGRGDYQRAVKYAKQTVAQRPWDTDAVRRLAIAQAEDQKFKPALAQLRSLASQSVNKAIPTLIYHEVNPCAYPGRNSSRQVVAHLERLAAEGYQFVTPPDFATAGDQRQVVLIIVDSEAPALREIDAALRHVGGHAVCAVNPLVLEGKVPDQSTTRLLKELQASGRWLLAASGPEERQRLTVDGRGILGNPLTHRLATPKGIESEAAMAARLRRGLGEAANSLPPGPRTLIYPKGDYGQYSLDTTPEDLAILKGVVQNSYANAVAADDKGFITPGYDPLRLPGVTVAPTWDEEALMKHLRQDNPYSNSRLDLAKTLYWQGQHEAANRWFRQAEALGVDPVELNFNWGANAYYEGDLPTSLAKLRQARELDPNSEKIAAMLDKAELAKRPVLQGLFSGWSDSDRRSLLRYGGGARGYVDDRLQLEAFSDRYQWARTGQGSEAGTRVGGGLLWYFADECWLQGRGWYMNLDDLKGHAGYFGNLHLPNPYLSGNLELETNREQIDTVEAVRRRIMEYRQTINTNTRFWDTWDCQLNFSYYNRTDHNDTPWVETRIVKRLHEWPFYGVGVLAQFADSNKNPEAYWSPQQMQKYQLYAATQGEYGLLHYSFSARIGPAKEETSDWRVVWGGRIALDLRIHPKFSLSGLYDRLDSPTYHRNLFWGGVSFIF